MVRVLISYRRDDSAPYAGRIYDSLCERLGRTVFLDIDSIEPGEDFPERLRRTLEGCHAVVAVIGPTWLNASDPQGRQRLQLEDDYVRLEVAEALRKGLRVIPVLVGGAELPKAEELPEDLRPLVRRQAVEVSHQHYREDIARLSTALQKLAQSAGVARPNVDWWRYAVAVALGAVTIGAAYWVWFSRHKAPPREASSGSEEPAPSGEALTDRNPARIDPAKSEMTSDATLAAPMKEGSLTVYASSQEGVALEYPGDRNSVFTKHFLKVFESPGLEFSRGIQAVTDAVVRETRGRQEPWVRMTYRGGFVIHPAPNRRRIALVIGNRAYDAGVPVLRSSNADARDMAALLERGGFSTDVVLDATLAQTRRALSRFEPPISKGLYRERVERPEDVEVALLYYSGHAFAQNGTTYMVPVDFRAQTLRGAAVPEDEMLGWLSRSGAKLKIAILDACRSTPLPIGKEN